MSKINLDRFADRKSFNNKAYAMADGDGNKYLYSYDTLVASFKGGKFRRHWEGWSATTARHIKAFCNYVGIADMGKHAWFELPVCAA